MAEVGGHAGGAGQRPGPAPSDLVAALRARLAGAVLADEPLAAHTTLRVGGPAQALVIAEQPADLAAVAAVCRSRDAPWLILGRGSNLLVADDGWPGVVVRLGRGFRGVQVEDGAAATGSEVGVLAGAAEPMPVLARVLQQHALGGLAFGVAIPGSLGGAVRMNAGAMGAETADVLDWAEVANLAAGGTTERLPAATLDYGYRRSALPPDAVVVRARLRLRREDPQVLAQQMRTYKAWRRQHQPINVPSCGSVFRNPAGDSAGRLIDTAGGKGLRVGGARISDVHVNFITVEPGATADDVHRVIRAVQELVARRHGVRLCPEVVIAGFGADAPDHGAPDLGAPDLGATDAGIGPATGGSR